MTNTPLLDWTPPAHQFVGAGYVPALDQVRLRGQQLRIWELMRDGNWRTLGEIEAATGDPQASISAQLRHLRKPCYGSHIVKRQRRAGFSGL